MKIPKFKVQMKVILMIITTIIAVFLWKGCENIDEKCVRYADVGSLYDEAV